MSNMSAIERDDTVSEPVAVVVVVEAVDGSNNVGALLTTQQSNTRLWKKTQFSWSHHGMNPKFVDTYIIHEKNYKSGDSYPSSNASLSLESQAWKCQSCLKKK